VLPRCHERPVRFSLPSLAAIGNGEIDKPRRMSRAMNALTTALACGEITPGEAATIAGVYETLCERPALPRRRSPKGNLLRILTAGDDVEDEDEDIDGAEDIDDSDP
jgi:hypothetical protein